jgi:uncharacterized protein DUF1173
VSTGREKIICFADRWIPLDYGGEKELVEKLVAEQRTFIKSLHYECGRGAAIPNFWLLDVGAQPSALDIVSAFLPCAEHTAKQRAISARGSSRWLWNTAQSAAVPDLPPALLQGSCVCEERIELH